MASAGASQQMATTAAAAPIPMDSRWNAICRQVLADSHGPTGRGLRSVREPAGMSVPATVRSLDRCKAVTPCTAQSSTTGPTMTAATYTAMCPRLPAPVAREKIAAPQATPITPSSVVPMVATNMAARALLVARQAGLDQSEPTRAEVSLEAVSSAEVMTSKYKESLRISIGHSCDPGCGNPHQGSAEHPSDTGVARWHRPIHDRDTRTDQDLRIHHCRL